MRAVRPGAVHRSVADDEAPRVVVVTGASSGIGRATALRCASRGDHLVLVARGEQALEDVAAACTAAGAASVLVHPTDVGDDAAVHELVAAVTGHHGRLDAVVHSAGVVAYGKLPDVPAEVFDAVVRTDLLGSANVARAVLPFMRDRDHGHLILIGSLLGQMAPPYMSAYAVSKWGVRGLARILQIENRDRPGVDISLVSPAGVDTPIYVQAANYLGRVGRPPPPVLSPDQMARAVLRTLERPRPTVQVGFTNPLIIFGYAVFPRVFDAIITPLFDVAAIDVRHEVAPGPGNVHAPDESLDGPRGHQGSPLLSIAAGIWAKLRR